MMKNKNQLFIFLWLFATIFWLVSCGDDTTENSESEVKSTVGKTSVSDTEAPEILRMSPADGAELAGGEFVFLFSEAVNEQAVIDGIKIDPGTPDKGKWEAKWKGPQLTLTIPLAANKTYRCG